MPDLAAQLVTYARSQWPKWLLMMTELEKRGVDANTSTLAVNALRDHAHLGEPAIDWPGVESDIRAILVPPVVTPPGGGRQKLITQGHGTYLNHDTHGLTVVGKHFQSGGNPDWDGLRVEAVCSDLTFENCIFDGYGVNVNLSGFNSHHVTNAIFRRCMFINAKGGDHAQGMFSRWTDGLLLEECAFIGNGEPSNFAQQAYITNGNTNVRVLRCLFAYPRGNYQLQLRCGGEVKWCLFVRSCNGLRLGGGGDDGFLEPGVVVDVANNCFVAGVATPGVTREGMITAGNILSGSIDHTLLVGPNATGGWPLLLAGDRAGIGLGSLGVHDWTQNKWPGSWEVNKGGKPFTGSLGVPMERTASTDMSKVDAFVARHLARGIEWGPQFDLVAEIQRIRAEVGA